MGATVYVVTSEGLGRGDDALGRRLMVKFLHQLTGLPEHPQAVVFYNAGVKLLLRTSPAIEAIKTVEAEGVEVIACGTCVERFGILDQLGAGRVSDMREIVTTMDRASKVVTV